MINFYSQHSNNVQFRGYDARPLKSLIIGENYANIGTRLQEIGEKEGFNVRVLHTKEDNDLIFYGTWLQDYVNIANDTIGTFYSNFKNLILESFKLGTNLEEEALMQKFNHTDLKAKLNMLESAEALHNGNYRVKTPEGYKEVTEQYLDIEEAALSDAIGKIHPIGGNIFIVKGDKNSDELLIGEHTAVEFSPSSLKRMFGVTKVHEIPQAEYHLDMFMRPLNNKRILISDDQMMLELIDSGIRKTEQALQTSKYTSSQVQELQKIHDNLTCVKEIFKRQVKNNEWEDVQKVHETLTDAGFTPIKVPGCIYNNGEYTIKANKLENHYIVNYMNANTLVNKDGEMIYITNKSDFDERCGLTKAWQEELDFGFEREFIKRLSPFVKKEHIHFISGDDYKLQNNLLYEGGGGIHCLCLEVPENSAPANQNSSYLKKLFNFFTKAFS